MRFITPRLILTNILNFAYLTVFFLFIDDMDIFHTYVSVSVYIL